MSPRLPGSGVMQLYRPKGNTLSKSTVVGFFFLSSDPCFKGFRFHNPESCRGGKYSPTYLRVAYERWILSSQASFPVILSIIFLAEWTEACWSSDFSTSHSQTVLKTASSNHGFSALHAETLSYRQRNPLPDICKQ